MRKVIIIDGSNYCGKTTITNLIKRQLPGAVVLEFHDYYNQHILNESPQINQLHLKSDYLNLDAEVLNKAEDYINYRNKFAIKAVNEMGFNHFIIERLFLTQMVYRDLLFGITKHYQIESFIQELSSIEIKLVFVTVSNEILQNRIKYNNPKLELRCYSDTPFHLKDLDVLMRKNDLYNFYFDSIKGIEKIKIDTSSTLGLDIATTIKEFIFNDVDK